MYIISGLQRRIKAIPTTENISPPYKDLNLNTMLAKLRDTHILAMFVIGILAMLVITHRQSLAT